MRTVRGSIARIAALCAVAGLALTGCASSGGGASPDPTDTSSSSAQQLPPVIVDLSEIDGTTVEVEEGNAVDLVGDDETFTEWTAQIEDESVVTFSPGSDDGEMQLNPGLAAESAGETGVTLTNDASGESVTFTVVVR